MKQKMFAFAGLLGVVGMALMMMFAGCGGEEDKSPTSNVPGKTGRAKPGRTKPGKEKKPGVKSSGKKAGKDGKRSAKKKLTKAERQALIAKWQRERAKAVQKAMETPPADMSTKDCRVFVGLRQALNTENAASACRYAAEAAKSSDERLRSAAVEALSWFGAKGMAPLTAYLADSSEEVRDDASRAWESALMEIEDSAMKIAYIETAMSSIADEVMLDAIAQNYNSVDDESSPVAVESIMRVVAHGGTAAAKAKEAYGFVTGDDWTNSGDAARWVANKRRELAQEAAGVAVE